MSLPLATEPPALAANRHTNVPLRIVSIREHFRDNLAAAQTALDVGSSFINLASRIR
jgi:hypothetical protein